VSLPPPELRNRLLMWFGFGHRYLSTGCLHGDHDYCAARSGKAGVKAPARCKFCNAKCRCRCHKTFRTSLTLAADRVTALAESHKRGEGS